MGGGSKRTGVSIPMSSNRAGFNPRLVPSYFANYRDKSGLVWDLKKATLGSKGYTSTTQLGLNIKLGDRFSMVKV